MSAVEYYLQKQADIPDIFFQSTSNNQQSNNFGYSFFDVSAMRKTLNVTEMSDETLNETLLKTINHNDIATTNNSFNNNSMNFNNNSFNFSSYNKSMLTFGDYDYKCHNSLLITPPPSFNPPEHYFSPPLFLPSNPSSCKKRSPTITKKERRRTHSINAAFSALRHCIPNVPSDTKLSKIKTLRLATSYIAFLINVLDKNDPKLAEMGFKADMSSSRRNENREEKRRREAQEILKASMKQTEKQPRGRTGWPQQVWANELK